MEPKISKPKKILIGFTAVMFLVLIIIAIVTGVQQCGKSNSGYPTQSGFVSKSNDLFYYATTAAEDLVEKELKYPLDSEFPPHSEYSVYYNADDDKFTVRGYVYAANMLGTKEKKDWTARFKLSDLNKDNYRVYDYSVNFS